MNWDVIGHEWAVHLLRHALEAGELSHAYLFTGPPGVGKGTLARALASALLCQGAARPCGACRACRLVAGGNHPDLFWVQPESDPGTLKVEQIRELQRHLSRTPAMGSHRVAILDRFDQATPSAANALLKTLEEPPEFVVLILLAPDTDSLLPTIVSRCQVIPLRPLPVARVADALRERWGLEAERARLLAHLSGGRLGWAVRAATDADLLRRRQQRIEEMGALLGAPLTDRFRYAAELAGNPEAVQEALDLWAGWWRDVLLLATGAESAAPEESRLTNLDYRPRLEQLAAQYTPAQVLARIQAIRAASERLRRNANPQLTLEVLLGFDL
ncbi:MAG: DNA polymerase III subunit delta' [Anaerolineae bacterium]|nr:DNA polymerase III subunit delta' [Anaerolineae bacterium]MDW8069327.1 DNA polymerase III subunit delta' [Anaerolineae bacterium]